MPEVEGRYKIDLFVIDDGGLVGADTVTITVSNQTNQLPNAVITAPERANIGDNITLDGSGSTDVDGSIVSFEWTQLSGDIVVLSNVGNNVEFIVPDSNTPLDFQLRVIDNEGGQSTITHEIVINQNPVANAGSDISVESGASANLNAAASLDDDGSIQSYLWSQLSGPVVSIQNSDSVTASFDTSNLQGDVVITLTVTDNEGATNSDTLLVSITAQISANQLPNVLITAPARANIGDNITLDGSGSTDVDGSIVSFEWTQLAGDSVVLTGTGNNAVFVVPDSNVGLVFQLRVTDNEGGQSTTTHELNINQRPVANAGNNISVETGAIVDLDATASLDEDGTIQSYFWSQQSGPAITIQNSNSSHASFFSSNAEGEIVIVLTVTDNEGATSIDTILATVTAHNDSNTPPSETPDPGTDSDSQNSGSGGALGLEFIFFWTFVMVLRRKAYRGSAKSPPA
jgi:hypothetical protein